MKRFNGFTLTELMIALAVIGILVAVVTPAIMKTRPNKNKMMIKKAYYTTENIVSNLINDQRVYPDMTQACEENAPPPGENEYCAWGFDYDERVNYEGKDYAGASKFQGLFAQKLNVAEANSNGLFTDFTTTDGMYWDFSGIQNGSGNVGAWRNKVTSTLGGVDSAGIGVLMIDVNGSAIGPNCLEEACTDSSDFDRFRIQIRTNGKMNVHPDDAEASSFVTVNTSTVH